MSGASNFIEVGGQLVRESAITRLGSNTAPGVTAVQCYVYVIDGGAIPVSQVEYRRLEKRFSSNSGRKSA